MTMWIPDLKERSGHRYLAIADAIAEDIAQGRLGPGDRLPPQRDLSHHLSVTVGTVTRAYAEAKRRGLLSGEVGRGTFVRTVEGEGRAFRLGEGDAPANGIDLRLAFPPVGQAEPCLATTLRDIADSGNLTRLLSYNDGLGLPEHRAIIAEWCARAGTNAKPEQVAICNGTQHAISVVLMGFTRPGDTVLTEALTFPLFKVLADKLGLRLQAVAMDDEGLIPDDLDRLCRTHQPTMLYCMSTFHNPTTSTMSDKRRRDVVAVARRYNLSIIEDDIYAPIQDIPPTPLAALAPELVYFIDSASKGMASGLRIGFILAPAGKMDPLRQALNATTWMAAPLTAEVTARWIQNGTAARLIKWQRDEAQARQRIVSNILGKAVRPEWGAGFHSWLRLPEGWDAASFVAEAERRGVRILPADTFAVGRQPIPAAVRIGNGAARSHDQLLQACNILANMLTGRPSENTLSVM